MFFSSANLTYKQVTKRATTNKKIKNISPFQKKVVLLQIQCECMMTGKIDTIIQFSGLKPGKYEYEYHLDKTFFEGCQNEELREGNVVFRVILEKTERTMLFHFSFHGNVNTVCDRCLGEMELPVEGKETLCVRFSDTDSSDDENVAVLPENAFQIDLAQWLYEYVAVCIPIQKVHPEGQCDEEMLGYISDEHKETDEEEGDLKEGEIDPRWKVLGQLLEEKQNKK